MPPPENQNESKTCSSMNIKTAFLAAASKKRKASSPTLPKKNLKLTDDVKRIKETSDDEVEIVSISNDIAVGECKENTDLNVCKTDNNSLTSEKKPSPLKSVQEKSVKSHSDSLLNSDLSGSEQSTESSDELNSSNLNTSTVSAVFSNDQCEDEDALDKSESEVSPNSKKQPSSDNTHNPSDLGHNENPSKRKRKMTPEEAKRKSEEREQKRKELQEKKKTLNAEKLKRRLEKEQRKIQKELERERKENEKKEKERLKLEKKEQEEKEKQQKLKEKEDLKKIRQMQHEMKLKEKKKKEELRIKREEEIRKAEEEKQKAKLEKEQKEKEKLERNKAAFMKFFVTSNKTNTAPAVPQVVKQELAFKPFQVSDDMTLAPVVPLVAKERFNKEKLDNGLKFQDCQDLYLQILKSSNYRDVRLRKRLQKPRTCDDVIVIDNSDPGLFLKAKFLQFSENVRPPYWGTWRKRSSKIKPRNPFGQDEIFDYDVDSDDEWDEGGPGESLSGTENEVESEDDYEVDNEFFVPHGYLSAEEEEVDDEVNDGVENDPEKQKAKLKLKQQEFELERKKKTTELKPQILGCYFENAIKLSDSGLCTLLQAYSGEVISETPILTRFTVKKMELESKSQSNGNTPVSNSIKSKKIPEEAMPHLIRLVHGNTRKKERLCKEFQSFWNLHGTASTEETSEAHKSEESKDPNCETPISKSRNISMRQVVKLLKEIATYGKISNPALKKGCWYVHDEVRAKYGLLNAPIPNQWTYVSVEEDPEVPASPVVSKINSIKGFLKP